MTSQAPVKDRSHARPPRFNERSGHRSSSRGVRGFRRGAGTGAGRGGPAPASHRQDPDHDRHRVPRLGQDHPAELYPDRRPRQEGRGDPERVWGK